MVLGYSLSEYVIQIIAGLGAGAVLFLIASGLTLIFGALRVVNFAHGSLFILGGYLAISMTPYIGFGNATFWIVMVLAGFGIALAGIFLEVFFFRPIYNRPLLVQLLVTFAFVLIIAGIARWVWGAGGTSTPVPPFLEGGVEVLDGQVPTFPVLLHGPSRRGRRRALSDYVPHRARPNDQSSRLRPGTSAPFPGST